MAGSFLKRKYDTPKRYKIDKYGRTISPGVKTFKIGKGGRIPYAIRLPGEVAGGSRIPINILRNRTSGQIGDTVLGEVKPVVTEPIVTKPVVTEPVIPKTSNTLQAKQTMPQVTVAPHVTTTLPVSEIPSPDVTSIPVTQKEAVESATIPTQLPMDKEDAYWAQKVGKTGISLDKFVQLAGMVSGAIVPESPQGRLGEQLSAMGGKAYAGRIGRERDAPNVLLQRRLAEARLADIEGTSPNALLKRRNLEADAKTKEEMLSDLISGREGKKETAAQIAKKRRLEIQKLEYDLKNPDIPYKDKWTSYTAEATAAGIPMEQQLKKFTEATTLKSRGNNYHYVKNAAGGMDIYLNGKLLSGTGTYIGEDSAGTTSELTKPTEKQITDAAVAIESGVGITAAPLVNMVNRYNTEGYAYVREGEGERRGAIPFTKFGIVPWSNKGEWVKQELPVIDGEQMTGPKLEAWSEAADVPFDQVLQYALTFKTDTTKPYTEKDLRSLLEKKKETDPTIDIERALKSYSLGGAY